MPNRLAGAVSPYLRSHADNPVDWFEWGEEAFAEAERRQVPVLVSIGYSTCHWCHVMARESFGDPALAAYLNEHFVAIKVDREEHPDVDASYLAAASAFTGNLGWPLNVFTTPQGRAYFAGTYWPPQQVGEVVSFRQVLEAVDDAWVNNREQVEQNAGAIATALAQSTVGERSSLPDQRDLAASVAVLAEQEDALHGGFGDAPKFPVAPVVLFLLRRAAAGDEDARGLAERTLSAMAASALRDPVDGGFFRYSTRADWTEPHYERMLYDNALLLSAYSRAGMAEVAEGIAGFLLGVLRTGNGTFASAQDSESVVDGTRVEGGYYALDAAGRAAQTPPSVDAKVITGWNGLAVSALAEAGFRFAREEWVAAAAAAADDLLARHRRADGTLARTSIGERVSDAVATLEDYGLFASGLLRLAEVTGEARYAVAARELVDSCLAGGGFAVPGGPDPVLAGMGLALPLDPSEGASPSGMSAIATAAHELYLLTARAPYREAAVSAMEAVVELATPRPISFGTSLELMSALASPVTQLVVVGPGLADQARRAAASVVATASPAQAAELAAAGFELFDGRSAEAAYLCRDFVCRLPITDPAELAAALAPSR